MRRRQEPLGVLVGTDALFLQRLVKSQCLVAIAGDRFAVVARAEARREEDPRAPGSVNPTLTMNFTRAEFDVVILVAELRSGKR